MNLCLVCSERLPFPPLLGGAVQTYVAGVLPFLSAQHRVAVISRCYGDLPAVEQVGNVTHLRVPATTLQRYLAGVTAVLAGLGPSLVHLLNRPGFVLPLLRACPGVRVVLGLHNLLFRPGLAPAGAAEILDRCGAVVTVSRFVARVLALGWPEAGEKCRVVYSGVDPRRFVPVREPAGAAMRAGLRAEWGLSGDQTLVLFAGRLIPAKGPDRLIRAMLTLADRYPGAVLAMLGGPWFGDSSVDRFGSMLRRLAEPLGRRVIFPGFVPVSAMPRWLAAADMLVCPSQWSEPMARVVYEAMATGLPVVASARGGLPEVVRHGETGLLVADHANPLAHAAAIEELLADPGLGQRLGQNGRAYVLEHHTWERVAGDLLAVYAALDYCAVATAPHGPTTGTGVAAPRWAARPGCVCRLPGGSGSGGSTHL